MSANFQLAEAAAFIVCSVLVRLGYFIGLSKSVPVPQTRIRFLGFLSDSILQAFLIPQGKRIKFATLRDSILQYRVVSIKTLQRFAGKITSFSLAVPDAQLYAREVYRAISLANRSSRLIKVVGDLRSEINHWRFLDSWSEHLPWMDERHLVVNVTSDASQYSWGGIAYNPSGPPLETRDIWREDVRDKPIAVKEALALVSTLKAGKSVLSNCRVDDHVDCLALVQAWERQGDKSKQLNDALKELFQTLLAQNISLCLQFLPSPLNQADPLSSVLSDKDCMLAPAFSNTGLSRGQCICSRCGQPRKRICFSAIHLSWSSSPFPRQGFVLVHYCGSKTVSSSILVASYSSKGISFCCPGP